MRSDGVGLFTIVMLPDVGHDIDWTTPGYSDMVLAWLRSHDRS